MLRESNSKKEGVGMLWYTLVLLLLALLSTFASFAGVELVRSGVKAPNRASAANHFARALGWSLIAIFAALLYVVVLVIRIFT